MNSKPTVKKKPRGKPFEKNNPLTGTVDERINRAGGPNRGASLKEIFDYYDKFTAEEIANMLPAGDLKRRYQQMQKGILLKDLKALTINAAIIFDPSPGLINLVHERTDGKVPEQLKHTGTLQVEGLNDILSKVYGKRNTSS